MAQVAEQRYGRSDDRQNIQGPRRTADPRVAAMREYFGSVPKDLSIDHIYSHGSKYGTINDALRERFAKVFKNMLEDQDSSEDEHEENRDNFDSESKQYVILSFIFN